MKILDIPQSGKRGLNVSQNGRYGQISRSLVMPTNPRTPAQMNVRSIFATVTTGWRALTEDQRTAWTAAAKNYQSTTRCGQSGVLTGAQLYTKINAVNLTFGAAEADTPPIKPQFPALAPQNLTITNTAGVIALKLTCPTDPGSNTIIRGQAPQSQGREVPGTAVILGVCPAPAQGVANITAIYTAKHGVPPVGTKVFVKVNQFLDGHESIPVTFSAIVPDVV